MEDRSEIVIDGGISLALPPDTRSTLTRAEASLDRLIEQELLWQEARRRKRVATDAEVKAAVRRFEAQFPDERRRRLALERGGFTDESYRGWVRQQLSIAWLVERDIAPTIRVGAAEVRADYQATLHRYTRPAEARARQVLARLPAGAGDEAARAKIQEATDAINRLVRS